MDSFLRQATILVLNKDLKRYKKLNGQEMQNIFSSFKRIN